MLEDFASFWDLFFRDFACRNVPTTMLTNDGIGFDQLGTERALFGCSKIHQAWQRKYQKTSD
jgi:hypothetical protein